MPMDLGTHYQRCVWVLDFGEYLRGIQQTRGHFGTFFWGEHVVLLDLAVSPWVIVQDIHDQDHPEDIVS